MARCIRWTDSLDGRAPLDAELMLRAKGSSAAFRAWKISMAVGRSSGLGSMHFPMRSLMACGQSSGTSSALRSVQGEVGGNPKNSDCHDNIADICP